MSETAAAIRRATQEVQAKNNALDAETAARLRSLYQTVIAQLQEDMTRYGDASGALRLDVLTEYLHQARRHLAGLDRELRGLLHNQLYVAAELGATPWAGLGISLTQLADSAARFVENFIAADGLKLSDRLWRLNSGTMTAISDALRRNVVLGRDATQATLEFLAKQEALPWELRANLGKDGVKHLAGVVEDRLLKGPGAAYSNALRVFRTEINRAHGEAYQIGAGAHPEVVGMRFMLSPNHPKRDICDSLAVQDGYGLGPGVYPVGQTPWPAHPNTMSYLTAVFREEVKPNRGTSGGAREGNHGDFLEGRSRARGELPKQAKPTEPGAISVDQLSKLEGDARAYVVGQGKKDGNEHLYALDLKSGRVLARATSHQRDAIAIPSELTKLASDPTQRIAYHHSHPDGFSLSLMDLKLLNRRPGLAKVVAHGHDGSQYQATRGDMQNFDIILSSADSEMDRQADLVRRRGASMTGIDAHLVNLALAAEGVIQYQYTLSPVLSAHFEKDRAVYERIVDELRYAIKRAR